MSKLDSLIDKLNAQGQERSRLEEEAAQQKLKEEAQRLRDAQNAVFLWDCDIKNLTEYLIELNERLKTSGIQFKLGNEMKIENAVAIRQRTLNFNRPPRNEDFLVSSTFVAQTDGETLVASSNRRGDVETTRYRSGTMNSSIFDEIVAKMLQEAVE